MYQITLCAVTLLAFGQAGRHPAAYNDTAATIVERAVKAIRSIKTLDCTMTCEIRGFGKSPSLKRTEKDRIIYGGPREISVRELSFAVEGPEGKDKDALAFPRYYHEIVADGKQYYALDAYMRRYVLHALSDKGVEGDSPGSGIFADYMFGDILSRGGASHVADGKRTGRYLGKETVGGVECHKITTAARTTVWIGVKDSLIRRCETKLDPPMEIVETYSIWSVNGPVDQSEFTISPPASAQRVDKFGQ